MTYTIAVFTVKTPDVGQRNCPKHVEFYSKNKLEKLVHLAGFILRIYHDARSHERQNVYFAGATNRKKNCNLYIIYLSPTHPPTHTHTHTYIYIYVYI